MKKERASQDLAVLVLPNTGNNSHIRL